MDTQYDKVLVSSIKGKPVMVVIHDTDRHAPIFYKLTQLDLDEIKELINPHESKNLPKS